MSSALHSQRSPSARAELSVAGKPLEDVNEYCQRQFDQLAAIVDTWREAGWAQDGWPRASRPSPAEVARAQSLMKQYVALVLPHGVLEKRLRWSVAMMAIRIWATDASATGDFSRPQDSTELSPFADYLASIDEDWSTRWRTDWLHGTIGFQQPQCVKAVDLDAWLAAVRAAVPDTVSDKELNLWAGRVLASGLKFHLADCCSVAEVLIEDICDTVQQRDDYHPQQVLCAATYFGGPAIYAVNNQIRLGLPCADLVAESIASGEVKLDLMIEMIGVSPLRMSDLQGRAEQAAAGARSRNAPFTTAEMTTISRTITQRQRVTEYHEVKKLFGTRRIPTPAIRNVERQVHETVPTGQGTWKVLELPLLKTLRLHRWIDRPATWTVDEQVSQTLSLSSSGLITSQIGGEPDPFDPIATIERIQRQDLTWETYDEGSDSQLQSAWHQDLTTASQALAVLLSALDAVGT